MPGTRFPKKLLWAGGGGVMGFRQDSTVPTFLDQHNPLIHFKCYFCTDR